MKNSVKLQKAVEGLNFATISNYDFVKFTDVKDLYFNSPFNAKSLCRIKRVSRKSISEIRNEIISCHAKQLHSLIFYYQTINQIWLKESQGWTIRGNWAMNGKVECYKDETHISVKVEDLKKL